jgi:hypothetical protein
MISEMLFFDLPRSRDEDIGAGVERGSNAGNPACKELIKCKELEKCFFNMAEISFNCGEHVSMPSKLLRCLPLWPTSSPRRDKDSAIVFIKPVDGKSKLMKWLRWVRGFTSLNCQARS